MLYSVICRGLNDTAMQQVVSLNGERVSADVTLLSASCRRPGRRRGRKIVVVCGDIVPRRGGGGTIDVEGRQLAQRATYVDRPVSIGQQSPPVKRICTRRASEGPLTTPSSNPLCGPPLISIDVGGQWSGDTDPL